MRNLPRCLSPLALLLAITFSASGNPPPQTTKPFLENPRLRVGLDLTSGGAICWLSARPDGPNLLNHADRGRLIQQSYYGKADGSLWAQKPWHWNPVQGGDYHGKPAQVLDFKQTATTCSLTSIPVHWATGQELQECRMHQEIRLDDHLVHITYRFTYQGKESHPPTHQELPAVFIDYRLSQLAFYNGKQPWKNDTLTRLVPGWPNERHTLSESWAAYLGEDQRGVGVYFPGTSEITSYRFAGKPGPDGGGCSYFAPIRTMAITSDFKFEYHIALTLGTVEEIRSRFQTLATASPTSPTAKKPSITTP